MTSALAELSIDHELRLYWSFTYMAMKFISNSKTTGGIKPKAPSNDLKLLMGSFQYM